MVLNEMNGDGPEQEDSRCLESDVIAKGNILETFSESQEIQELINSLRSMHGDLSLRETVLEKFKGMSSSF